MQPNPGGNLPPHDLRMPSPLHHPHHAAAQQIHPRMQSQNHYQTAQLSDLEKKILSLNDSMQRDDVKLRTLQDLWTQLENVYNLSLYEKVIDKLIQSFLNLFCTTPPQFISENNTQALRKLILEVILRISGVEAVKPHSKELMKQMMRLIAVENEDNAILAIKIIIDQGRCSGRMPYSNEVSSAMALFKKMIMDLTNSATNSSDMFAVRESNLNLPNKSDEQLITTYLNNCYHSHYITLNSKESRYLLMPSASKSVKVLQEVPMLVVFFYQHHKHTVQTEAVEFMKNGFNFLNVRIPKDTTKTLNQALADSFVVAQSKFLSFVNIMGKVPSFNEVILQNGSLLVTGVLQLLEQCPADLIPTRKDVLITLKYLTSGDLRMKFFHMLPRMISETALLGTGFTSIDNLRTFMYQMLADLLHHMRSDLSFEMLSHVSFIFCRQLHDSSTNTQVQIMSARLLNSVTECMTKMEAQNEPTRDLLLDILEALVSKLKILAVYHLPALFQLYGGDVDYEYKPPERPKEKPATSGCSPNSNNQIPFIPMPSSSTGRKINKRQRRLSIDSVREMELLPETPFPYIAEPPPPLPPPTSDKTMHSPEVILSSYYANNAPPVTLADGKNLVKFMLQTCKFATAQLKDSKLSVDSCHRARERDIFERLLKYGIICMDVFVIPAAKPSSSGVTRSKDEKDTLESLASVFTSLDHGIFRELFEKYMDFLIERIFKNYPLQLMVNTFLVRNEVPFFASIMLKYLMGRMDCLAVSTEKTALYVKLFKIIFSAIGTHQPNIEGEKMLKPFLPDLIRRSTILALSAREPLNYFLLLRALFRSIGGGAHDILYGKFLPLLPNLLQFLNKLQSCQHRPQMRELFVELCLTVPVRLSSLLPYLPLLMDPLVCALNGSHGLVQQGLRTLELCVDNLQPEYLFEHMAPVRGALMQGLWKVVGSSNDAQSVAGAFRILGKFGGANRKMLNEPQILQVSDKPESFVNLEFSKMGLNGNLSIHLNLSEVMKVAVEQMKLSASPVETNAQVGIMTPPQLPSFHLRKQCMELARSVLLTGLGPSIKFTPEDIEALNSHVRESFMKFESTEKTKNVYKCGSESDRTLFINALLVLFYGVISKDALRQQYLKFFNAVLRQLALIGILEYSAGTNWLKHAEEDGVQNLCMDASVLVDALAATFSDSNKDFCFSAMVALRHIKDTCASTLKDIDMMSNVPFCQYLIEKVMSLCHGPAWFARLGGASALSFMIDHYPKKFIEANLFKMISSLMEVILGTVDEISSGSVDMATECLEKLQKNMLVPSIDDEIEERRLEMVKLFASTFAKQYFHGSVDVRIKMKKLLKQCAEVSQIGEDFDGFVYHFREYFVEDIKRTMNTTPYMSLSDATASLSSIYDFLNISPSVYDFESEPLIWMRFQKFLLDISQTDTNSLLQRQIFKKCETCASHFLPPYPITDQVDELRACALKCLVTSYQVVRKRRQQKDISFSEETMDTEELTNNLKVQLALDSSYLTFDEVFDENNEVFINRILTIALRTSLNLEEDELSRTVQKALKKVAPISLNILSVIGEKVLAKILTKPVEAPADQEQEETDEQKAEQLDFDDVVRLSRLNELNPKILTKTMMQNITDHAIKWKIDKRTIIERQDSNDDAEFDQAEAFRNRNLRDADAVEQIVMILASCEDIEMISAEMAVSIAKFAAFFEYTYSQDVLLNWIPQVAKFLSKFPKQIVSFFFSAESLVDSARRSFFRRIIEYPESLELRKVLMEDILWTEKTLEGKCFDPEKNEWQQEEYTEKKMCHREMFVLHIIDSISRLHMEWFASPTSPIEKLKKLFKNPEFKQRYFVRSPTDDDSKRIVVKHMTEHKYKVPKLIVNCFLRYLRMNHLDFELFFDVLTVFIGNYVTDFCYVREFLETEVIPVMSSEWRREVFVRIMQRFDENPETARTDLSIVKVIQYLVNPCLQWSFERYDVDVIIGAHDENEEDPTNLVSILARVVDSNRQKMSDGMVIVFYQLCTLFVQHASHHIHNNNNKKQGGRLRVFMLFAWPCITCQGSQDPTTKYTGFLFLANIIKNFTINRKIVLQVYSGLTSSYQQDHREQIRKAIDLLTPSIPYRMEDGTLQMVTMVKRVLVEECHNLMHVQHIFQMIIRNYRVFYHLRNDLLTPLMNAVQRALIMPNSVNDAWVTRRLAIEVCEMVLKWDLLRNKRFDINHQISVDEAQEIENVLENLKQVPTEKDNFEDCGFFLKREKDEKSAIPKEHIDQICNMLIRFCLTFQQINQPQLQATATELVKKSHGLLRVALRGVVWGDIATIRPATIEKYMMFPQDLIALRKEDTQTPQVTLQCNNSQSALEVVLTLVNVMPKNALLQTLRPLQRAIISCLNSGFGALFRSVNALVGKLFEKTRSSAQGLEELEIFNQYLNKFLNEHFTSALKSTTAQITQVYTAFSLLRVLCTHQPGYLDAICLNSFYKVTERMARELLLMTTQGDVNREKGVGELVCFALELIKPRIEFLPAETRRNIANNILGDLIMKTSMDKIIDCCLKILSTLINVDDMEFSLSVAIPLLVRAMNVIERKFKHCKDVVNSFLTILLRVYQNAEFRNHDVGKQLWEGFFWGLTSSDAEIREKFLVAWESTWPHLATIDMTQRMKFILQNQDWSKFKQFFWLRHALWCMLRCVSTKGREDDGEGESKRKRVLMLNCASPWKTFEVTTQLKNKAPTVKLDKPQLSTETRPTGEVVMQDEPMDTDETGQTGVADAGLESKADVDDGSSSYEKKLMTWIEEQTPLLEEASNFDFAQSIESVAHIAFGINDTKFVSSMWVTLFKSFCASLTNEETNEFKALITVFMSSGSHNSFISGADKSVLAVWLDAVNHFVELPSMLIEFIASRHECWHSGIKLLEKRSLIIPKQLSNQFLTEGEVPMEYKKDLDTLESLAALYDEISEFDQYSSVWDKRALKAETGKTLACMQLGDMEGASTILEGAMTGIYDQMAPNMIPKQRNLTANGNVINEKPITPVIDREYDLWLDLYMKSSSELLQWQFITDIANQKEMQSAVGLIRAATHIPDWNVVEECKNQIAGCIPPKFFSDFTIYNMMVTVMKNTDNGNPAAHKERIKIAVHEAMETHIAKWRALPPVVSYAHAKILQSMNIIREVEESVELRCSLEEATNKFEGNVLQDMKNLIKIWRSRAPTNSDEMSFVSTVYDWRLQIHMLVLQRFEHWDRVGVNLPHNATNHSILPIHSAAQGQLAVAKTARSLGFFNLSKDVMNRMATITAIPMIDAHNKVCEYAKTLKNMALATTDEATRREILLEALEVLEDVKYDELNKDQLCRIYYQRGSLQSILGRPNDAHTEFTAAASLVDFKMSQVGPGMVNLMKSWGHHEYNLFFGSNTVSEETANLHGRQALTCYFSAARVDSEQKAKKYIARIMWLAKHMWICGPTSTKSLNRVIQQQLHTLNVFNWVYFLPQLVTEIKHRPNSMFILVLIKLIPVFSMQVFYYLREIMPIQLIDRVLENDIVDDEQSKLADDVAFADEDPMMRILMLVLRYRPTDIRVFHRLLSDIDQMAEFWVERHLRYAFHLKDQIFSDLSKQMDASFNEVKLSNEALKVMAEWKKNLVEDLEFYEKNYQLSNEEIGKLRKFEVKMGYLGGKKARVLFEKEMKRSSDDRPEPSDELHFVSTTSLQMIKNLSLSPDEIKPLAFVEILIICIKGLKERISTLPRRIPLELTSAYLARFSHRIGCVEMPFDLLNVIRVRNHNSPSTNQSGQYVSMVSRFEPLIEIAVKGGQVTRRLNIRGQTGKTCSFYLKKFVRRERTNRVPQMFSYFNHLLQKDRETSRRHLCVPMMTQLKASPHATLIEIASIQPYIQPLDSGTINQASNVEIIHPLDILEDSFAGSSTDDIVHLFYDRFGQSAKLIGPAPPKVIPMSTDGSLIQAMQQQTQPHHIRNMIYEDFSRDNISNRLLCDYLANRYVDNTMYFMLRKQIVHCLSVMSVIESHCNLSPLGLDQIMLTANNGSMCNPRYAFELAPRGTNVADISWIRPEVPFRLTPNFAAFIGIALEGDLMWSMAATAKCLWKRNPDIILKPLLWDELADNVEPQDMRYVCHAANRFVNGIMRNFENTNSVDAKLRRDDIMSQINRAKDSDNLARMPPTYHPWF